MNFEYSDLEKEIGYKFKDKSLLINALTHSSYANEHKKGKLKDNERLEFLGDAVLELISSEYLYLNYNEMPEGKMTKLRASLVCEPTLAMDAKAFHLDDYIYLGKGEEETGGRSRNSIVSDAFEALIGAVYLDGGLDATRKLIMQFALNDIDTKSLFYDSKTVLQERLSYIKNCSLSYLITNETGPDHNKSYEAVVKLGEDIIGTGVGHTKKAAEQQAAYCALKKINKTDK